MNNYYVYFYFPDSVVLNNQQEADQFIYHLQMIIDRIDCEVESIFYYDSENLEKLLGYLDFLQGYFSFVGPYPISEAIRILLTEVNFKDISIELLHDVSETHAYYRYIDQDSRIFVDNFPSVLKEITERSLFNKDHKVLFFNFQQCFPVSHPIHLIKCYDNNLSPEVVSIEYCCDFQDIDIWIDKNTPEWKYNYLDNRHIDGHPDRIHWKSPLLDGQNGKKRAEVLLQRAVKDRRKYNYRINYDNAKNCYIRFEDENALNQYHGYHLIENKSFKPDQEAVKEIPKRVKKILAYRQQLNLP